MQQAQELLVVLIPDGTLEAVCRPGEDALGQPGESPFSKRPSMDVAAPRLPIREHDGRRILSLVRGVFHRRQERAAGPRNEVVSATRICSGRDAGKRRKYR